MAAYRQFPFRGFGGGLNLRDGPDVVSEDQAIDLLNVLFTTRGAVAQRSGYAKLTQAEGTNRYDSLSPFYKADGTKQLVAGAGNRLEAISTAGAVVASSAAPTANPLAIQSAQKDALEPCAHILIAIPLVRTIDRTFVREFNLEAIEDRVERFRFGIALIELRGRELKG